MLSEQLPGFRDIRIPLRLECAPDKRWDVRCRFLQHGLIEIRMVAVQPPSSTVFDRTTFTALIELDEETYRVLSRFEVRLVEAAPVVVGDEAAMLYEMFIKPLREVRGPQSML